jgi:hypothetical protein
MVRGGCNSLELPTNPSIEGKEENRQRRKADLVGRVVKIEERMRVGVRRFSPWKSLSLPRRVNDRMAEVSDAACEFPTQAEDAVTEILSLRPEVSSAAQQRGLGDHRKKVGKRKAGTRKLLHSIAQ